MCASVVVYSNRHCSPTFCSSLTHFVRLVQDSLVACLEMGCPLGFPRVLVTIWIKGSVSCATVYLNDNSKVYQLTCILFRWWNLGPCKARHHD